MMINDITKMVGAHKKKKRIGRGPGSGNGKTAGRGHKGARSRAGWSGSQHAMFEGGQMPYYKRIPKRGFTNANFRKDYNVINLKMIEARFEDGAEVTPETLDAKGLIRNKKLPVKILAEGELTKKFKITAAKFSASAQAKIEAAGGTVTVEEPKSAQVAEAKA